ncbi:hypothetical protein JCM19992_17630 [Thermostilla marina]
MNRAVFFRVAAAVIVGSAVVWMSNLATAQETTKPSAAPTQAAATQSSQPATNDAKTGTSNFRPRLPNYYAAVVSEQQRQQIYAIQREYWEKIQPLLKQLEALEAERDAKIEAVLSPEQKAAVQKARDEAAARRKSIRQSSP